MNVNHCYRFIHADFSSFVYASVGSTPCKWKIYTASQPVSVGAAGNASIAVYNNLVDIALVEDSNGTIIVDGVRYKKALSAEAATKVNTNITCFDVARITPSSSTAVSTDKKIVDGADNNSVKAFLKSFMG